MTEIQRSKQGRRELNLQTFEPAAPLTRHGKKVAKLNDVMRAKRDGVIQEHALDGQYLTAAAVWAVESVGTIARLVEEQAADCATPEMRAKLLDVAQECSDAMVRWLQSFNSPGDPDCW